ISNPLGVVGLKLTSIASITVGILLWLLPVNSQAAVPGIVKAGTTVYSSPDQQTKSVGYIAEITRVQVVGKSGKTWFKIEATLNNGKKITGWVEKSQIGRDLS